MIVKGLGVIKIFKIPTFDDYVGIKPEKKEPEKKEQNLYEAFRGLKPRTLNPRLRIEKDFFP